MYNISPHRRVRMAPVGDTRAWRDMCGL